MLQHELLHLRRSRFLWQGACYERMSLHSYAPQPQRVQIDLRQVLGERSHHAGIVRSRRKLGEDYFIALYEELDAEEPVASKIVHHFARHFLRRSDRRIRHRRGLP